MHSHSQKPKGPTVKAIRGLASSSNSTCQYPDFKSSVENHTAPCKQSRVSSILGNEYPSFTVLLFNFLRSMQNLSPPSLFLTSTTALAQGLKLFLIAETFKIVHNFQLVYMCLHLLYSLDLVPIEVGSFCSTL